MENRSLVTIAEETLSTLQCGLYTNRLNQRVELADLVQSSLATTRLITPAQWPAIEEQARKQAKSDADPCPITITPETTLQATERLVLAEGLKGVCALNFASAKNAGGGFKNGARAQEETLARSSGLYPTLTLCEEYYTANRRCGSLLYTDHAIFSGDVPVFKNDAGELLDRPYLVSFITMPAANPGAMRPGSPELERIPDVMRSRIRNVLALAVVSGQRHLVLGAWGCGAFRNDADQMAGLFAEVLAPSAGFRNAFESILFAVFTASRDRANYQAFESHLKNL